MFISYGTRKTFNMQLRLIYPFVVLSLLVAEGSGGGERWVGHFSHFTSHVYVWATTFHLVRQIAMYLAL